MVSRRLRILYVTHHCPHARSSGSQIRALHIGRLLQQCGEVRLVLLQGSELDPEVLAKTNEEFVLETVMRLTPYRVAGIRNRLRHELDPWFLNTEGWCLTAVQQSRLRKIVADHDVVWVHGFFSGNTAGLRRWPRSILDIDDVVSQYHRSAFKNAISWSERALSARQLWLWRLREAILFKRFDIVAVCSEADRRYLGAGKRIHTIPNGYGIKAVEPLRLPANPPRIGFIGTLNYPPNSDGIRWFISQIWPTIKKACPAVRFRLAGAGANPEIEDLKPDVDHLGWVDDPLQEIATWSLAVVPIRVGGGTRIKIVESFSRKCPVVSTTWGAFGYDVKSGEDLLLADDPPTFAAACLSILRDPRRGEQLAKSAWDKYAERWTWSAIGPKVSAAVEHCLSFSERRHKSVV